MKKKSVMLLLTILMASCFTFTACGETGSQTTRSSSHSSSQSDDEDEEEDEDEDVEEAEDDADDRNTSSADEEVFVGEAYDYEADPDYNTLAYSQHYELHVYGDGTATFMQVSTSDAGTASYNYTGECSFDNEKSEYSIVTMDTYGSAITLVVEVDGSKLVDYDYTYAGEEVDDFSAYAGNYSATTECGKLEFEIEAEGLVNGVVYVDDQELEASLIYYGEDNNLDLMFTDANDEYHDWYIYPNGNSFDYEDYNEAVDRERRENYVKFAGDYEYTGSLGDITITITADGASTSLVLNGNKMNLENGTAEFYEDTLSSVSFDDGEGAYVSLYLTEDGTYSADFSYYTEY